MANTAKRKILGGAQLVVFAVPACKIFAAMRAALKKNHFSFKDALDCVYELFDVVIAFDGEDGLLSVIFTSQVQQEDEFFFFHPWKLEGFLIQNRTHSRVRTCSF